MDFFSTFLGKVITTFFISMVPVIELRGAIPAGVASGIGLWFSIVLSVIGNMIPVPFIIIFIRNIFEWLRKKSEKLNRLVTHFEEKADKHRETVNKYKFWGLCILVAIPLPGTGAWTGALVAAMMEMRLKDALPAIFLGVLIAAAIVAMVTCGVSFVFF
ncbi:MAG: small multi-drug export protein [Clostridia bacterium]|nr:small multi-drug export protein [Clostridia bacterium]